MSGVPYTFATASTTLPLQQLDTNFQTPITIGNTSVALGNTITTIGNLTLTNVTISSGNVTVNVNTSNATITGGNISGANITNITGNVTGAIPNSSITNAMLVNANVIIGNTTIALGSSTANLGNITIANATIQSGTISGLTTPLPVASGGTGVTASSGASSVVLRDVNANVVANSFTPGWTSTATAAGTTTLTVASTYYQRFTGSTTQTVVLPNATTMALGQGFIIDNDSTGNLTLQDGSAGALGSVVSGMAVFIFCESNGTTAGSWSGYMFVPGGGPAGQITWGTANLSMGGANITNVNIANITTANITNFTSSNVVVNGGTINNVSLTNITSNIVTQLVAGTNITLSPANGVGTVTINSSGGGGGGTGAVANGSIYISNTIITTSYSFSNNTGGMSVGPVYIQPGNYVNVAANSRWVIL